MIQETGMHNPSTIPNTAISHVYTGFLPHRARRPIDIKSLGVSSILIPKRERQLDYGKVEILARSMQTEGLLQPIGVRHLPLPAIGKYELIYGYHRIAAVQLLMSENKEESGRIAAVIYPSEMPDWACKLCEIAENLARSELTAREREAQLMIYGGLLKKHKLVADADNKRRETQLGNQKQRSGGHDVRDSEKQTQKPTITRKLTSDLGVTERTVRRQVDRAKHVAEKAGLVIPSTEQTLETMSADTMEAIGQKLSELSEAERKVALKDAPKNLETAQSDTTIRAKIDTIDPKPFIDWCRRRIEGKFKPMSLEILKAYRKALDELIAEFEN